MGEGALIGKTTVFVRTGGGLRFSMQVVCGHTATRCCPRSPTIGDLGDPEQILTSVRGVDDRRNPIL